MRKFPESKKRRKAGTAAHMTRGNFLLFKRGYLLEVDFQPTLRVIISQNLKLIKFASESSPLRGLPHFVGCRQQNQHDRWAANEIGSTCWKPTGAALSHMTRGNLICGQVSCCQVTCYSVGCRFMSFTQVRLSEIQLRRLDQIHQELFLQKHQFL
jgi:hypothetical protein